MRKNSDPPEALRRLRSSRPGHAASILVFLVSLGALAPSHAQTASLGICRFALNPSGKASPSSYDDLLSSAAQEGVEPLSDSLSRLMTQSVLPLPPKPAKDASFPPPPAYEFKAASADESVFASPKAALETCDFAVSGIYSLDGETIEASLYLVEKSGSRFAHLGTCTGDIGRLETLVDALASLLIEKLASPAIRVIDLDMVQTDASWEVLPKDSGFALVGKRIFIYKKGNYSIRFGKPAPEGAVIAIEADTGSDRSGPVYNKIQPKLIDDKTLSPNRADGSSGKDPALALKEAARLAAWDGSGQEKAYAAFSRSLSRLIVSVPVSALALGIFFLGYEAYARSGIDLGGLALRTAPALISLGCSLGFAIDTGIRIGGLTRASH